MERSNDYKQLKVWKKSMQLCLEVYKLTGSFPDDEKYGLTSQTRRSAVSLPSNIVEGQGRRSKKEFKKFLNIAFGSLLELETQLIISLKLGYLCNADFEIIEEKCSEIKRMLIALDKSQS